jgi:hypothetical protein
VRRRSAAACAVLVAALVGVGPVAAQDGDEADISSDWDAILMFAPPEGPVEPEDEKPGKKRAKHRKKGRAGKRARGASYDALKQSWHSAVAEDGSWNEAAGVAPMIVHRVGASDPCVLVPDSEDGGFDEAELQLATEILGGWPGGPIVSARLLDLIYKATRHFDVRHVNVVSGIRRDRQGSRHSHGLAADIVLPGVDDEELAAYFRAQGFVGVGTYTRGGFIHIDVREASYFWVDKSAPGQRSRQHQVHAAEARAADAEALERGERPHVNPEKLDRALKQRATRRKGGKTKRKSKPRQQRA